MRLFIAAALTAALATAAAADPPKPAARDAKTMHDDDCARARAQHRTCVLTIGGEDVGASPPTATGSTIRVVTTPKQPSLVRVRRDFIVQIIQSADDL
jgi:hypothetical protein